MVYLISNFEKQNTQASFGEFIRNGNIVNTQREYEDDSATMDIEHKFIITIVWSILIITGVIGNGFVIFTIIKSKRYNNVLQCYLLNLAITDFLFVIFCIPITLLTYIKDHWVFGVLVCKIFNLAAFSTVCATCLTLTMMTIDRYILICNIQIKRNTKRVFYISTLIWIVSLSLGVPYLIYCNVEVFKSTLNVNSTLNNSGESFQECTTTSDSTILWNYISGWYSTVINYIIPSIIINFCYIRIMLYVSSNTANIRQGCTHNQEIVTQKKRKVSRTIILFTSVFIILWFPIHALTIWYRFDKDFPRDSLMFACKLIAHTMTYLNPTINPIIYAFSNELFKLTISDIFPQLFKKENKSDNTNCRRIIPSKDLPENECLVDTRSKL